MDIFFKNVIAIWGDRGRQWLNNLPATVAALINQWQLRDVKPFANLSYNYVLSGYRIPDKKRIVLKIGCDQKEVAQEVACLRVYNGYGCVQLLDYDDHYHAMLLEHIAPGISLKSYFPADDERAILAAVQVVKQLHAQPISKEFQFPTIADWLPLLTTIKTNLISKKHLDRTWGIASDLLQRQSKQVLLHGDLHHENILSSGARFIAIDPKGVLGEPAYEVGAFIRNPFPELLHQPNVHSIIMHRLTLFAQLLDFDKKRLKEWSYVQAVLAACWSIKDEKSTKWFMAIAEIIDGTRSE